MRRTFRRQCRRIPLRFLFRPGKFLLPDPHNRFLLLLFSFLSPHLIRGLIVFKVSNYSKKLFCLLFLQILFIVFYHKEHKDKHKVRKDFCVLQKTQFLIFNFSFNTKNMNFELPTRYLFHILLGSCNRR